MITRSDFMPGPRLSIADGADEEAAIETLSALIDSDFSE